MENSESYISETINLNEENVENLNILGNGNQSLKNYESKPTNKEFNISISDKNSIYEYEKINKKLSILAELIENKFDNTNQEKILTPNEEKKCNLKNNISNEIKVNNNDMKYLNNDKFKFYENFITPNFVQSIKTNEIYLLQIQREKITDFLEGGNNIENKIEKNGNDLINIDDILEIELKENNKNISYQIENNKKVLFEEDPFKKNYSDKFSNHKGKKKR